MGGAGIGVTHWRCRSAEVSAGAPAVQVWWYVGGFCYGRMSCHSLATGVTLPVRTSRQMPAVLVMAQARSRRISP